MLSSILSTLQKFKHALLVLRFLCYLQNKNNMEEKVIQDSEKKNDFVLQNSKKIEDRIYYF